MNLIEQFFEYALKQENSNYTIENHTKEKYPYISYNSENVIATVSLNNYEEFHIIDMKIENSQKQKVTFYIHFDLKDLQRAIELLQEMLESLNKEIKNKDVNILLCCTSGVTTSYLKEKLNNACELLNVHYHFDATFYKIIHESAFRYDLILLAPQIFNEQQKLQETYPDIPVECIDSKIFASGDIPAIIKMVHDKRQIQQENNELSSTTLSKNLQNTLALCIRIENGKVNIYPVFYHLGNSHCEEKIIKDNYNLQDIFDIIDYSIAKHSQIENIVICTPGIIDQGKITFKSGNLNDVDIQSLFENKYHKNIYLINDANAMALGYYIHQSKYGTMAFYFHPTNTPTRTGGMGYIINGQLHLGHHGLSGEMQYLSTNDTKAPFKQEEAVQVVSKYFISSIAHTDPEAIIFYCNMIPSSNDLKKEIEKAIQPRFIPELIKVNHCIGYMLVGGLAYVANQNRTFDNERRTPL